MKKKYVEEAIFESNRFLTRAMEWLAREKIDKFIEMGSREGGALRRASLDLAQALTKMRK